MKFHNCGDALGLLHSVVVIPVVTMHRHADKPSKSAGYREKIANQNRGDSNWADVAARSNLSNESNVAKHQFSSASCASMGR